MKQSCIGRGEPRKKNSESSHRVLSEAHSMSWLSASVISVAFPTTVNQQKIGPFSILPTRDILNACNQGDFSVEHNGNPNYNGLSYEGSRREFLELAAQFDTPAFIRRAQNTAAVFELLMHRCKKKRLELAEIPSMRLATIAAMVEGSWHRFTDFFDSESYPFYLQSLHEEWQYELKAPIAAATDSKIKRGLKELFESFARFNVSWQKYVDQIDFSDVNQVRSDYNNYYVCEKAAAFDSERIAQEGFEELPPVTAATVLEQMPLLQIQELRS